MRDDYPSATVSMSQAQSFRSVRVFTIGHSTRTLDELVSLLRSFDISVLADIRTIPRSRHNPQFNEQVLSAALRKRGVDYVHLAKLGGLRRARKDSPNLGWRNDSFRGFADYMLTEPFEEGLAELHALTTRGRVAIMCAEAVPWRCHRSLVADALTARGASVEHISGASHASPHHMTTFARVEGKRVIYPAEEAAEGRAEEISKQDAKRGAKQSAKQRAKRADAGGRLATHGPFHLEATVRVLQRRPTNPVEVWREGRYLRVLATPQGLSLVEVENRGTFDAPDVRYVVRSGRRSAATRARLEQTLRRVLGLDMDPAPLQRLAEAERALRPTAIALRGMRPPRFSGLFETFANVVPFQQVSLDAGLSIVSRLVHRFGEPLDHDGQSFYAFPTAQSVAAARLDALRKCGLSRQKAESLRRLARAVASGDLSEEGILTMSTSDALRSLAELPGIGPWSAALVLLRGFGRIDVFPPGDVGVVRGLSALLHLGTEASLDRIVERFGDRRGYLYFCALGGSLLARGLIHPAPAVDAQQSDGRGPITPAPGSYE